MWPAAARTIVRSKDALLCRGAQLRPEARQRLPHLVALRWRTSGKSRFNMIRQRALRQHVDYLRQLDGPRPYRSVEVDPQLQSSTADIRTTFQLPSVTRQPTESELAFEEHQLRSAETHVAPIFSGELARVDLEPFGSIKVVHGDIFAYEAETVVLPMSPNLLPYRGLGLESYDRGGRRLVEDTFEEAKKSSNAMQAGDTLLLHGNYGTNSENIIFSIMPWFWEGSPRDAGKRFRDVVRRSFLVACGHDSRSKGFETVALPNIGGGIYGFEPRNSSRTLVEEAVEALLQIEASRPNYKLRQVCFVESRRETAEALQDALTEVAHRWLPEHKLTTAPQFWGDKSRRLVVLPDAPNFFWKRNKITFKKRHGIKKRARHDYIGNIKPWLWRAQRVQQPPPMLVYAQSGDPAPRERQLKARPYYFRGVSHWLFPSRRGGFHQMRRSARGQWVGLLQQYKIREAVRPRM